MNNPFETIDARLSNIECLLLDIKHASNTTPNNQVFTDPQTHYAYSIAEAAKYFHVSQVTFQMWKNSGFVKYTQHGRKLIIDLPGTLELLGTKKRKVQ
jgi:hypothetical protein